MAIWSPRRRAFCLPGGSIESGESVREAAARELLEETGMVAVEEPILLGVAKAVKLPCAAVWIEAAGVLRGSEEGAACLVRAEQLLQGPYGEWAAWALGLAKKRGLT